MSTNLSIVNSSFRDIDFIFFLFNAAISYQAQKGYNLWPQFERSLIEHEIKEKCHFKIVSNGEIVCVFSVLYSDPVIWMEKNKDPAVYLHRIAVNPKYKGKKLMNVIRGWAIGHAQQMHKQFVRMDTWGNNEVLRDYYIGCGFNYIGQQFLEEAEGLPVHYGGSELSLFEIKI
ncbi:MAG: GNAT family N-acetyltransferase [Bacteroidia bacterium]